MLFGDSVEKIIKVYFRCISKEPFEYKNKIFTPKPLRVSPLIFRSYVCPEKCGACCRHKFTMDFLPTEHLPKHGTYSPRYVELNKKKIKILTENQEETREECPHLNMKTGRCENHPLQAFSCDFEPLRFLIMRDNAKPNCLTHKLFGRGWSYKRVDGGVGAACRMLPYSEKGLKDTVKRLKRLHQWASNFQLSTHMPEIIEWVGNGPHNYPRFFGTS